MAFNFPNTPSEGTTYTAPNGAQYIYSSGVWRQVSAAQIKLTARPRNRIVNGAMQISQENPKGTASGVANTYIADQWVAYFVTAGIPSFAVNTTYHPDDPEAEWWLRLNNSSPDTSIAAGDYYTVRQAIEGICIADFKWGTANAKPAVLRFRAYSGIAGTFCVSLRNAANAKTFVKNCVIAANVGTTFVIPIPAITSGVWPIDNSKALDLNFTIMAGSNYNTGVDGQWADSGAIATPAISNWMSAASQPFDISAVGLYVDPDGTGAAPPWEMPDEAEELQRCQRYYQKMTLGWAGQGTTGVTYYGHANYTVTMRASPALSGVNGGSGNVATAVGTLEALGGVPGCIREGRACTVTSAQVLWFTYITANARM